MCSAEQRKLAIETMVRLATGNEALLTPFVDSKGNFGKYYSGPWSRLSAFSSGCLYAPVSFQKLRKLVNFSTLACTRQSDWLRTPNITGGHT